MDKHQDKHSQQSKTTETIVGHSIREAGHIAGEKMHQAGDNIDAFSEKAADKSDEYIHRGQKAASQLKDDVEKYFEEYSDTTIRYIKKNPLRAALIAAGIGLLIGRWTKG